MTIKRSEMAKAHSALVEDAKHSIEMLEHLNTIWEYICELEEDYGNLLDPEEKVERFL